MTKEKITKDNAELGNAVSSEADVKAEAEVVDTSSEKATEVFESGFKQGKISDEYSEILKGMSGDYVYNGAPLCFQCRAGKEHNLTAGKTYKATKLPKHELIANAILRGLLVSANPEKEV